MKLNSKKDKRLKIRKRIRSKIFGTESVPDLQFLEVTMRYMHK